MDPLPFEPNRFETAAPHYLHGRPAYAGRLIERVATVVGLRQSDRVLDLGCGPGQLARAFAPYVAAVLGIDPEPNMLSVARRESAEFANVTFHEGSSYDLDQSIGKFRMVVMGRSFHWMDRAETLRRLDGILDADGAVVLFGDTHPDVPDNAWRAGFRAILDRYGESDSSRTRRKQPNWARHENVLLQSSFATLESIGVYDRRALTAETLAARALSMSSTSHGRLGERARAMLDELAGLLPDGRAHEVVVSTALLARRR